MIGGWLGSVGVGEIGMKKTFRLKYANEMCVMLRRRRNKTEKKVKNHEN